ncbi:hypothetical protein MCUN1_002582 [Malassezia cuniculi]|uniref:L-ornithine N(5)-monooxygenase [NAD(P)H] n=1 Tax=Malassezia cuniculi TaxID=948313 RepID=A0AAF0ES52_9BASI|nr:hypothetical protein MCUN1_002582 [Malassezia cuniculi]
MAPAAHRVTSCLCEYPPYDADEHVASVPEHAFFDLVVIGSGPAALAAVTRILETRPAALYTEDEKHHLHWLKKSSHAAPTINARRSGPKLRRISILVIDRLGDGWLGLWNRLFAAYEISHLRSPMFFHPDPADLGGLLEWTVATGRNTVGHPSLIYDNKRSEPLPELLEIPGVVGKEVSKHKQKMKRRLALGPAINERDRRDYATPGAKLFQDFCNDIVARYGLVPETKDGKLLSAAEYLEARRKRPTSALDTALVSGNVAHLDYGTVDVSHCGRTDTQRAFSVRLGDGTLIGAKAVISAVGTGGRPNVPDWLATHHEGWVHSTQLATPGFVFPPKDLTESDTSTLVVIGGGLSSAQICDIAIRRGVKRVVLLLRGHFKSKPFDLGLEWIGKYSNLQKMQFWQCSDPVERHAMILNSRNGGSLTPTYAKLMLQYASQGRLEIRTHTQVVSAKRSDKWKLELVRAECNNEAQYNCPQLPGTREDLCADYIVSSTGAKLGFSSLPFMETLSIKMPVPDVGGLPVVTEDLQYGSIPLFCVGAYSALQIGPAAFNLGGMREAAERVAVRLGELQQRDRPRDAPPRCADTFSHFNFNVLVEDA